MYSILLNKKVLILPLMGFLILFQFFQANAQNIPEGYYDPAEGLDGETLKQALNSIISGHTAYPYTSSSTDVWDILKESDRDPDNSSNVILLYTGRSMNAASEYDNGTGWNREHVWAKSHGGFDTNPPAGTDCHHLRPADISVNSARGNKDFDNGGSYHSEATECRFTSDSWEPRDAVKGDVARMMFYMTVRYEGNASNEPDLELVETYTSSTDDNASEGFFGVLSTLLAWHYLDPVDDFERNRNNVVYSHQHNRNPFIDHPEYVASIWNDNSATSITNIETTPATPNINEEVNVSATISDADGISSVKLMWGLSNSTINNEIVMNTSSGSNYVSSSTIPGQANNTEVFYKINVVDNTDANSSSSINSYFIGVPEFDGTLLDEDFETLSDKVDIELDNWINFMEVGSRKWQSRLYDNNLYAQASSYASGEENIIWLISPKVDLGLVDDPEFSFDVNVGYWRHSGLSVLISSDFDGTNVSIANWSDITSNFTFPTEPTDDYGNFSSAGIMDLSTYSNTIYVAFKYTGNAIAEETSTYQIDNVLVKGTATQEQEDIDPPALSYSPSNEQQNISVNTSITINANEPMLKAEGQDIDAAYLQAILELTKESENGEDVPFSANINSTKTQITITPITVLDNLTTYYLTLAVNSIEDTASNVITNKQSISFTTSNSVDAFAPTLLSTSLTPDLQNVRFSFNEKIFNAHENYTLLKNSIWLSNDATNYIALSSNDTIILADSTVEIKLNTPLSNAKNVFKIDAKSIKDSLGNLINEAMFSDSFDASGNDSLAPEFIVGYPQISNITTNTFRFTARLNEPCRIYYKLQTEGAAPSINDLINSDYIDISSANEISSFVFGQLLEYTNYQLYYVSADKMPSPNIAENLAYLSIKTKGNKPVINSPLLSTTACLNSDSFLNIEAESSSPLTYQWYFNNLLIEKETNDTVKFTNISLQNSGEYYCLVTNDFGEVKSDIATLNVIDQIWSGQDSSTTISDTVFSFDINQLLSSKANQNGIWIDVNDSRALIENVFYPSLSGNGVFSFIYLTENECFSDSALITITVEEESVIGLNDFENNSCNIYPNPNNGEFSVSFNSNIDGIEIYSLEGKRIEFSYTKTDNHVNVSLNNKTGIYFMKIIYNSEVLTRKVIIQN